MHIQSPGRESLEHSSWERPSENKETRGQALGDTVELASQHIQAGPAYTSLQRLSGFFPVIEKGGYMYVEIDKIIAARRGKNKAMMTTVQEKKKVEKEGAYHC